MIFKLSLLFFCLLSLFLISSCVARDPLPGEELFFNIKKSVAREDWRGFCRFLDQESLSKVKRECQRGRFSKETEARLKETVLSSFYVDYTQRGDRARIFVRNKAGIQVLYLKNNKIVLP